MGKYRLKDILKAYSQKNTKTGYEPVAVGRYGIRKRSEIYKKELSDDYSKNKVIFKNTLTIGMGSVQIDIGILSEDAFYSVSPAYYTFKINTKIVSPSFLDFYFKSFNKVLSDRYMIASARQGKKVDIKGLLDEEITIPSFEEQSKIVHKFEKLLQSVERLEKQIDLYDELLESSFVEMFGVPSENTKWPVKKLATLCSKIGSGSTPKGGRETYKKEGISLIRSMNVYDGFFKYDNLAHISDEQATKLKGVTIYKNDLLFNITGGSIARCCIVPNDVIPARVNQHVSIIRLNDSHIDPIYLNYYLINSDFKEDALNEGEGGGATRQALTKEDLSNFSIVIPPLELQRKFAVLVNSVNKQKHFISNNLLNYRELFEKHVSNYFD